MSTLWVIVFGICMIEDGNFSGCTAHTTKAFLTEKECNDFKSSQETKTQGTCIQASTITYEKGKTK